MNSLLQPYEGELSERLSLDNAYPDPNNNGDKTTTTRGDKYSLRPRSLRRGDEENEDVSLTSSSKKSRASKPKQKPAPLSKYRRKTANARERSRMREINAAFESLRRAIPHLSAAQCPGANEKLTKITTLRLAMKYISALSAVLRDSASSSGMCTASGSDLGDLLSDCSDLDYLFLESDGESLQLHSDVSDSHSHTPADLNNDFPENSLTPVDFDNHQPLSPMFPDQSLSPFDTFFTEFS